MRDPETQRSVRRWGLPALIALGLHVLVGVALIRVGPLVRDAGADPVPPAIEVVFAEKTPEPQRFTELPEDRRDAPPERAELLSNVDSRARDDTPGGEDETPALEGIAETPMLPIPEGDETALDAAVAAEAVDPDEPEGVPEVQEDAEPEPSGTVRAARAGARAEVPALPSRRAGDVPQVALRSPDTSSPLNGSISLSTTEWAYGDWLVAFRRAFMPNWRPPSGYRWMLIHGRTVLEIHIDRRGEMRSLDIVGRQGHDALHDASVRAVEKTAPFQPLPDDFPDEELVLRLELIYPKIWQ